MQEYIVTATRTFPFKANGVETGARVHDPLPTFIMEGEDEAHATLKALAVLGCPHEARCRRITLPGDIGINILSVNEV